MYWAAGQRAYYATRALVQRGHLVRNITGGYESRLTFMKASPQSVPSHSAKE